MVEFFDIHIRAEDGVITNVVLADGGVYRFGLELSDSVRRKLYRAIKSTPRKETSKVNQRMCSDLWTNVP